MALRIVVPAVVIASGKGPLRKVMRAAGNEIAKLARAKIRAGAATRKRKAKRKSMAGAPPVGRTGNLARNIKVTVWKSGEGVTVKDTARSAGGSGAPYALFLEKGALGGIGGRHPARNKWGKQRGRRWRISVVGRRVVQPHPFMTPATEETIAAGLGERVRDAIIFGMKLSKP